MSAPTQGTPAPTPVATESFAPTLSPTSYNETFRPAPSVNANAAIWGATAVSLLVSLLVTVRLLNYYARLDTPLYAKVFTGTSWFCGIAGILTLLPLDLVMEFYYYGTGVVGIAETWRLIYWLTFLLAWIVCPIAQEYHVAGHFTFGSRLWDAIKSNLRIYIIIGIILAIAIGILAATKGVTSAFLLAIGNFYGMFLIVVMVGYGLVEVPSSIWRASSPIRALESHQFRAGSVETNMIDAEDQVEETVEEIVAFRARVARTIERNPENVDLLSKCDLVLELAPRRGTPHTSALAAAAEANTGASAAAAGTGSSRRSGLAPSASASGAPDNIESLPDLHRRLKRALVAAERARWEWSDLLDRTASLERLIAERAKLRGNVLDADEATAVTGGSSQSSTVDYRPPHLRMAQGGSGGMGIHAAPNSAASVVAAMEDEEEGGGAGVNGITHSTPWGRAWKAFRDARHYMRVRGYTTAYRTAALGAGIFSAILLWCAVISPFAIHLSIFGVSLNKADSPFQVWLCSFLPLMYISTCVYTALFKFRYLDVLALHNDRQTDAYNLLYNASYMARLQFSLGVFFFEMLLPQDSNYTAFRKLVGDMDTVPLLGENFNKFSPILILFFSLASLFSIGDRFLDFLGIDTHKRPRRGVPEHEERILEGKRLIQAARARRDRDRRRVAHAAAVSSTQGIRGLALT